VGRFASVLRRPPDTATTEDVRQFQLAQSKAGIPVPTMNSVVSALWFFFTNTLDRPNLARKLVRVSRPGNLPVVLSRDEGVPLPALRNSPKVAQGPERGPWLPSNYRMLSCSLASKTACDLSGSNVCLDFGE